MDRVALGVDGHLVVWARVPEEEDTSTKEFEPQGPPPHLIPPVAGIRLASMDQGSKVPKILVVFTLVPRN